MSNLSTTRLAASTANIHRLQRHALELENLLRVAIAERDCANTERNAANDSTRALATLNETLTAECAALSERLQDVAQKPSIAAEDEALSVDA